MKKRKLIFIIIFFIFISCKNENIKYKYYDNGIIQEKIDINKNKVYTYYKNGKIKYISGIKGNKLDGKFIKYYDNGIIQDSGYYQNDNQIKTWYYYKKSGLLDKVCNYVSVYNLGSILNEITLYNKNGDTIEGGHSYRINSPKDTVLLGEKFVFSVIIEQSLYNDTIGVVIGNFDSIFYLKDSVNIIESFGVEKQKTFSVRAQKLGTNTIRGIIYDFKHQQDSTIHLRNLFFSKKFYVK